MMVYWIGYECVCVGGDIHILRADVTASKTAVTNTDVPTMDEGAWLQ